MSKLSYDCLNDIFEYLENDKDTLHSCILVNRLWCEVSVRIFWRNGYDYNISNLNTLVACLPNESKEILNENGIIISTPTSKFPIFNYASFCKILPIYRVRFKIRKLLNNQQSILFTNLNNNVIIVEREIHKMLMNQISLKKLIFFQYRKVPFNPQTFTLYIGSKDCLKNLSELNCNSSISSEFFYQLSKICHNIILLKITIEKYISNGLSDLIRAQKNLKYFSMTLYDESENISLLIKNLPNTLINLNLYGYNYISLSFISKFINLQELIISIYNGDVLGFEELQNIIFPKLQILNFECECPKYEEFIKFLENNGKNLKELYVGDDHIEDIKGYNDISLNLAIVKLCPNLRKLSTGFGMI
ncbi:hypothetical protein RhiirB3_431583 [Rhizophagus irregularis]|nr:hypothetical protein RhiirB3_431583 [Rhizophagus irregularis]